MRIVLIFAGFILSACSTNSLLRFSVEIERAEEVEAIDARRAVMAVLSFGNTQKNFYVSMEPFDRSEMELKNESGKNLVVSAYSASNEIMVYGVSVKCGYKVNANNCIYSVIEKYAVEE